MASQVLSGANNASYTNNTGQNVRLIINYMSNVTSMTWAGVSVTAESTTIGKDIQNITGEFRRIMPGEKIADASDFSPNVNGSLSEIRSLKTALVTAFGGTGTGGVVMRPISEEDKNARRANANGIRLREAFLNVDHPPMYYIPKTISRGGDFPTELMLANGESFSSVCGAFNAIIIKEDGT
jgi:hypothetical protein